MKPRAILFDLDDTITTFSAGGRDFWAEALEAHRDELDGTAREALRAAIEQTWPAFWSEPERRTRGRLNLVWARREIVRAAVEAVGPMSPVPVALADRIADHFTHGKEEAVAPFAGAIETLEALRARGMPLGLVTNGSGPFQRRKLARYDLARFFDVVVIEGEFGTGKPDPENFRAALAGVDAPPEATWMVGDNLNADIAGAQRLGIHTIWNDCYRRGLPEDAPARPDRTVHAISELLAWV